MSELNYQRIAKAIGYLQGNVDHQPSLKQLASIANLSEGHFQREFKAMVGVSPKRYLQALTVLAARGGLSQPGASVEQVADELGLSAPSRLHDHFVQLLAVSPGEYRAGGAGLLINYGIAATVFGQVFFAWTERGLCNMAFVDDGAEKELASLQAQWPAADLVADTSGYALGLAERLFSESIGSRPLLLKVRGTNFQFQVWQALLKIPAGCVWSYSQLAAAMGRPSATRAVASAVAANPVAFLIPCHRVVRADGNTGQYRWGAQRKQQLLAWEQAQA